MLKKYRQKFIILNMVTVGLVLVVAFVYIGAELYRSDYNELKNVMSMIVKPWNASPGKTAAESDPPEKPAQTMAETDGPQQNKKESNAEPPGKPQQPDAAASREEAESSSLPEPKGSTGGRHEIKEKKSPQQKISNDNILTYFYSPGTGEISLLSDDKDDYDLPDEQLMKDIAAAKDSFGELRNYGIIYYKEHTESGTYKIAVTDVWYINSTILRISLILFAVFLVIMGLLFLISMRLARIAAKPMEKAIEMERRFVRDISHDLKTPVTVILANNSILKSNPQTKVEDNLQWIDSTDTAAREMRNMINEMLTLSRLEADEKPAQQETVSLSLAAERAVLQLESVAYENGIRISTDIEENVNILASSEHIKRICSGLLENALKYEPEGGAVDIKVNGGRKAAVLCIHNSQSFIPPEELSHIFESFYRGDKTRSSRDGHGLGLPIVRRMTELSGGTISARSSREEGTSFSVSFEVHSQN